VLVKVISVAVLKKVFSVASPNIRPQPLDQAVSTADSDELDVATACTLQGKPPGSCPPAVSR
jgi:hypothetical protein